MKCYFWPVYFVLMEFYPGLPGHSFLRKYSDQIQWPAGFFRLEYIWDTATSVMSPGDLLTQSAAAVMRFFIAVKLSCIMISE